MLHLFDPKYSIKSNIVSRAFKSINCIQNKSLCCLHNILYMCVLYIFICIYKNKYIRVCVCVFVFMYFDQFNASLLMFFFFF